MSDQSQNPNNSISPSTVEPEPQAPAPTLRETIEAAYDEAEDVQETGQEGRVRDSYGRFVAKDRVEPGEAEPAKAPSPDKAITAEPQKPAEPAPQGRSTQPPEHWSAEDRATFAKLPLEGQSFLMRRHQEMEADYTRKAQAASGAVQFTQALAPVFEDPVIQGSLQQYGLNAAQAVQQWAAYHKRAQSPDPREKITMLAEIAQNMGFDPARLFVTTQSNPPPNLSQEDMNDPAIRYFADHASRTQSELQAVKTQIQTMLNAEAEQREKTSIDAALQTIEQFEHEKDASGRLLRPYFNDVVDDVLEIFEAHPERGLQDAYRRAVRTNDAAFEKLLAEERQQRQGQSSLDRAKAASRGNTRGITSPVAKPSAKTGNGSLRDLLERTADEVGL